LFYKSRFLPCKGKDKQSPILDEFVMVKL